jgi:hypothetical protein
LILLVVAETDFLEDVRRRKRRRTEGMWRGAVGATRTAGTTRATAAWATAVATGTASATRAATASATNFARAIFGRTVTAANFVTTFATGTARGRTELIGTTRTPVPRTRRTGFVFGQLAVVVLVALFERLARLGDFFRRDDVIVIGIERLHNR